jgi:pyrroline-5-carboxylate reductase
MITLEKISFIGCGNMSSAIIQGLINKGLSPNNIIASNRSEGKLHNIRQLTNIQTTTDNIKAVNFSNVIILAVKPQILPQVCQQIKDSDLSQKLIISIAAGTTINTISKHLEQEIAVVRTMPNTPSTISEGATGLFANNKTSHAQKEIVKTIFSSVGLTEWVNQESLIDVVTAIAGSVPAYVFLFMQSMIDQAVEEGLDPLSAKNLAVQAVLGSAKLAQLTPNTSLTDLRKAVTSPNGTTHAAITCFEDNHFSSTIKKSVKAAITRGKEIGEQV